MTRAASAAIDASSVSVGAMLPIFVLISRSALRYARRALSSEYRRALLIAFAAWGGSEPNTPSSPPGDSCRPPPPPPRAPRPPPPVRGGKNPPHPRAPRPAPPHFP